MKNTTDMSSSFHVGSVEASQNKSFGNDNRLLDEMRMIVKIYVTSIVQRAESETHKNEHRKRFEGLRKNLQDPMLKAYSSFEFMEKLYTQEHLLEE